MFQPDATDIDTLAREFRWRIPELYNIAEVCCDAHRDRADQIALYCENVDGHESQYSFGQLIEFSNRLANALQELGIRPGDRVGVVLPPRAETVIAHFAIYKLGAVALPLSILFGPDALRYRLQDSGARMVITDAPHLTTISALRADLSELDTLIGCDRDAPTPSFWALIEQADPDLEAMRTRADDPALLVYTSGTTGPPKGALVAHRALIGNLPGFELSHDLFPQPGDLFWTPADWAWTGGLMDALLPSLHYGVPILGYAGGKFDPDKACALMEKYQVRNCFMPPTAVKMLMQVHDLRRRYDVKLRSIMSAGEQVTPELLRWSEEVLGVRVNEMWGQTEVNYLVGNCAKLMEVRPGSMGKPYPGHQVEIIDQHGELLADGEQGELAVHKDDPVMCLGYWNQEQATRAKFVGDWFRTGDVGYRDADGYLWFMGRKDDVISSAGYRIGPGEIEDCLLKHPAVAQAAVIGKPDALRGNIVKAFIVLGAGHEPGEQLATNIQASVRSRLAAYEYPREIEFVDELPMTTTGKVRRIDLRQREIERARSND
jgi:acetyl-CoA synthetase